jgi:hypothetical protein
MYVTLSDLTEVIAKNACESGADTVEIEITESGNQFRVSVTDDGKGMSRDEAERAIDPFGNSIEKKGHGLGIAFLVETVNEAAGSWDLHSEKGSGTTFTVWFDTENIETPPVGDVSIVFRKALLHPDPKEVIIRRLRRTGTGDVHYEIKKSEISDAVGGFNDPQSLTLLSTYLRSMEEPSPFPS